MSELENINNNNPARKEKIIELLHGNTYFTTEIKEYSNETLRHEPIIVPNTDNKNNMIASSPTEPNVHEGTSRKGVCTFELNKRPVNKEVLNTSSFRCDVRHIAKHKEKVIKCHINPDLACSWFQTNVDDTEKFRSRSGYIFIWKQYFEILKGRHMEKINRTLLLTLTQAMSQHTHRMPQQDSKNKPNITTTMSWKKLEQWSIQGMTKRKKASSTGREKL